MNLRKIFLSVLLLWIFAAGTNLMAQGNTDPLPNNTANSSLEKMLRKIVEETVDAMRVKVISGELSLAQATIDSLQSSTTANGSKETTQLLVRAQLHPATISTGTLTTVSTEVDTTTFTSTTWQKFGVFAVNDTLEIALSGSFADAKIVYPFTQYTFENFSPSTFPKGYIRRYGGAGTVSYVTTIVGY